MPARYETLDRAAQKIRAAGRNGADLLAVGFASCSRHSRPKSPPSPYHEGSSELQVANGANLSESNRVAYELHRARSRSHFLFETAFERRTVPRPARALDPAAQKHHSTQARCQPTSARLDSRPVRGIRVLTSLQAHTTNKVQNCSTLMPRIWANPLEWRTAAVEPIRDLIFCSKRRFN